MTPPEAGIFRFFLKESNMKLSTLSSTGLAAMLLVGTATAASALNFDFSFSDDGSLGPFDILGTVTGEITGLANNAKSAATHVYIDTRSLVSGTYAAAVRHHWRRIYKQFYRFGWADYRGFLFRNRLLHDLRVRVE
jgi:hypothetical protein